MKLSEHLKHQREDSEYVQIEKNFQLRLQIANAIIDSRIAKGWSQSDLAEKIGTKQANISRIEAGIANPTLVLLEKLVNILEIRFQIWGNDPSLIYQTSIPKSLPVFPEAIGISSRSPNYSKTTSTFITMGKNK